MSKTMTWAADGARPWGATLLHLAAALLRAGSAGLDRIALRMTHARRDPFAGHLEFHALHGEAGAPEGALYVDGKLVGHIAGLRRL